ncbi:MAG: CPBP family intramembrane glutamic endopeptidase [Verrucomicrobiota bacterium]
MPADKKLSQSQRTWLALVPAMVVPSLGALCYFIFFTGTPLGQTIFTVTKIFGVAWPILTTLFLIRHPGQILQTGPDTPPLRDRIKKHLQSLPLGLISGLIISAGILAVAWLTPLEDVILAAAPAISQKINDLGFANNFLLLALGISLVNSAMEEYYWRWFVYGNLRHVIWLPAAHLLAALAFTAHHLVVTTQFFPLPIALLACAGVFTGGLIWSALYQHQKSILGVWLSHILVDLAIFIIAYQAIT